MEESILAYGSRGRVQSRQGFLAAEGQSRKLKDRPHSIPLPKESELENE